LELKLNGGIENYKREHEKARKRPSPFTFPLHACLLSLGPTYRKELTHSDERHKQLGLLL